MSQSLSKYHPRIGYTYMPSVKTRVPWESGGYLVRTNSAGFRSDREFAKERTPGKFRAILFGDSQTAGDGLSNSQRYSELLEGIVSGLEVFNYGITGTGPDEQYMAYQEYRDSEHDLLIIGLHVENIGRIAQRYRPFVDPNGKILIYAKPYFTIEGGELVLHQVPVPKTIWTRETLPAEAAAHVYSGVPYEPIRDVIKKLGMRDLMQKVTRFQPVSDYDSPGTPNWLLLRKILETWIRGSKTPVLLVLIPMWPFIDEWSDPTAYQARFRELATDTGCHLHDPLADLWNYPAEERREFRLKIDTHLTFKGHQALAKSLAPVIERIMRAAGKTPEA
jgi:carbamoyltransferase